MRRHTGTSELPMQNLMRSQRNSGGTLAFVKVPKREKGEVLAAFPAHKAEVTAAS